MSRNASADLVSRATPVPSSAKASPDRSVGKVASPPPERGGSHAFVDGFGGAEVVDVRIVDIDAGDLTFQYRFKTKASALCAAIARQGQEEPVHLTNSKPHRIIDGFQRINAIKELGWPTVKAFVHHGISEEKAHEIAFTQNVVRKNLSPIEKANAIRLARKRGCEATVIAAEFGLSEKQILRYEKLLTFTKDLQELVDEGEISMAHAAVLARFAGMDLIEWVERIQEKKWSASDLGRAMRGALPKRTVSVRRQFVRMVGDRCRVYEHLISMDMSPEDRARAIAGYTQAIRVLQGGEERLEDKPETRRPLGPKR